jgi:dTDP-glucose 4,6-dehydratase
VNTGIARIFNCYGPRLRPNDGRAIPTFIWQALHDEALTVTGDGTQTRSACFVDDLVDGMIHLMNSEVAGPVNLGNPEEVSVLELAGRIRVAVGTAAPIEFVPRPPDDPSVRRPDVSLAGELLGWQPTTSLDDGLKRTVEWFRDVMDESGASGSTRTGEK